MGAAESVGMTVMIGVGCVISTNRSAIRRIGLSIVLPLFGIYQLDFQVRDNQVCFCQFGIEEVDCFRHFAVGVGQGDDDVPISCLCRS